MDRTVCKRHAHGRARKQGVTQFSSAAPETEVSLARENATVQDDEERSWIGDNGSPHGLAVVGQGRSQWNFKSGASEMSSCSTSGAS